MQGRSCDERSELRNGLGIWVRIVAVVGEGVHFVWKYDSMRFSEPILPFKTRRFAPRPISPEQRYHYLEITLHGKQFLVSDRVTKSIFTNTLEGEVYCALYHPELRRATRKEDQNCCHCNVVPNDFKLSYLISPNVITNLCYDQPHVPKVSTNVGYCRNPLLR